MSFGRPDLHTRIVEAAHALRDHLPDGLESPLVAIVLGSGLGALADRVTDAVTIPYDLIPHFPRPTVAGHLGNVLLGQLNNTPVLALQGRFHYYEGHDLEAVTFPVRILREFGITTLILTAATGGINPAYQPGDLMVLSDHLNLLGTNPLRGPNDDRLGLRFPRHDRGFTPGRCAHSLSTQRTKPI